MILRLSSPPAPSLLALLASMFASRLAYSDTRSAFFVKISGSASLPDVRLVPQSAENTEQ
jgi:hypothetical protein